MRFAVSSAPKAIVIGALGCAAAFLVACGDRNGLIPGDQASKLSSALDGVSAACQAGDVARAQSAATKFSADVQQLRAAAVDANLVRGLRQGAATLEQLVADSCDSETVPTQTTVQTTPQTTPETAPPVTQETAPPPETTPSAPPETTPPDTGGGTPRPTRAAAGSRRHPTPAAAPRPTPAPRAAPAATPAAGRTRTRATPAAPWRRTGRTP